MGSWPAAVVFDFDGVIVNSEPLHCRAYQEALAAEGIALTEEEYYRELIGFDDRGCIRRLFQMAGRPVDPDAMERVFVNKRRAMHAQIARRQYQALPGVEAFVRALWRRVPLAICSGALRDEIEAMLDGVGLRECFPVIVAAEDVTVAKPDPGGYVLAIERLARHAGRPLAPADCLIVEDAPAVIRAARGLGFSALGVASTYAGDRLGDANWVVRTLRPDEVLASVPRLRGALYDGEPARE